MCLDVNVRGGVVRERGTTKAPTRKVAYKLVTTRREAPFRSSYIPRYTYRSIHTETDRNIMRGRRNDSPYGVVKYNAGIHVFTTLRMAQKRRRFKGGLILRVEVNAADWVASGDRNDAVYRKIKVGARVK